MKVAKGYLFLFLFVLGLACTPKNSNPGQGSGSEEESPTLSITKKTFKLNSGNCQEEERKCAKVEMNYPFIEQGPESIVKTINDFVKKDLIGSIYFMEPDPPAGVDLKGAAEGFMTEFKSYQSENPEMGMGWQVGAESEILHHNAELLSFSLLSYSYTGGAHPNSYNTIANFDLTTGKELKFANIVRDTTSFKQIAKDSFKASRTKQGDEFSWDYYFWGEGFQLPENFGITAEGLLLYYNPYEAAAYALGATEYIIPYKALEKIIDPDLVNKAKISQ